jgi:hypothetical protein
MHLDDTPTSAAGVPSRAATAAAYETAAAAASAGADPNVNTSVNVHHTSVNVHHTSANPGAGGSGSVSGAASPQRPRDPRRFPCDHCGMPVSAPRFAPHLEKCMGLGGRGRKRRG